MRQRDTSILGFGSAGRRLTPLLLAHLAQIGAASALRTWGIAYTDRLTDAPRAPSHWAGAIDISTTQSAIQTALATTAARAEVERLLLQAFVDRLVRANPPAALGEGQILIITEAPHARHIAPALQQIRQRLPRHILIVLGLLPEPGHTDAQLEDGYQALEALHAEGVVALCLLMDPRSPLACSQGEDNQEELALRTLASLIRAPSDDSHNLTLGESVRRAGSCKTFAGLALGAVRIESGPPVRWYAGVRSLFHRLPLRAVGDPVDMRNQTTALTERILHDTQARTIATPLNVDREPLYLTYTLPFGPDDARLPLVVGHLRHWLVQRFPTATAFFVCGNGTVSEQRHMNTSESPREDDPSPYFAQVGCVFAIDRPSHGKHPADNASDNKAPFGFHGNAARGLRTPA